MAKPSKLKRAKSRESAKADTDYSAHASEAKLRKDGKRDRRCSEPEADDDPFDRIGTSSNRFTTEKRKRFLELYASGDFTVKEAAKEVGVSHVTIFNFVNKNEIFARKFQRARSKSMDALEDHLHAMAYGRAKGNIVAVFGTLKARRPEIWRDKAQIDHTNSDGSFGNFVAGMTAASRELDREARVEDGETPQTQH